MNLLCLRYPGIVILILFIASCKPNSSVSRDTLPIYAQIIEDLAVPVPPPPAISDSLTTSHQTPARGPFSIYVELPVYDENLYADLELRTRHSINSRDQVDADFTFIFHHLEFSNAHTEAKTTVSFGRGSSPSTTGDFYMMKTESGWKIDSVAWFELR